METIWHSIGQKYNITVLSPFVVFIYSNTTFAAPFMAHKQNRLRNLSQAGHKESLVIVRLNSLFHCSRFYDTLLPEYTQCQGGSNKYGAQCSKHHTQNHCKSK